MGGGCLYPKPGQLGVFCAGRELRLSQPQIPKGPLGIFLRPLPSSLVQGWGGGGKAASSHTPEFYLVSPLTPGHEALEFKGAQSSCPNTS